jgi:hypothetical protein
MSDERQYVAVKFRESDQRQYTYHYDGPPLCNGDQVKVPDRDSDGWKRVIVVATCLKKPQLDTKAILGIAPPEKAKSELPI